MKIIADLHIHSRYSRATSSRLNPACLERWARIKGIGLLGTGDCTHPQWLSELRENFEDAEPGLFVLRKEARAAFDAGPARTEELPRPERAFAQDIVSVAANGHSLNGVPRFVLTGEISTIYKRDGKTRKVHHLVILPGFKAAAAFQLKLERIGNIRSDGRPILGIDSRDLLSLLLDVDEGALLVPAHIWTPWFSALGAKSGFDSIEECYGDLSRYIPAIETGLSSDPPMNWALSSLDRYSIISNSDAHSPDKLGREATIFDMDLSCAALGKALYDGVLSTIEFFPEEGKYHYDGHRKCGVCLGPKDMAAGAVYTAKTGAGEKICPVCGKALTRGVMGRVLELADRPLPDRTDGGAGETAGTESRRRPFYSLIPLKEILGELLGTGAGSKKVDIAYNGLIEKTGSEFSVLMEMSPGEIERIQVRGLSGELLAEAIGRMRRGEVSISAGYDGEYGVIRVFPAGADFAGFGGGLFDEDGSAGKAGNAAHRRKKTPEPADFFKPGQPALSAAPKAASTDKEAQSADFKFDAAQEEIINYEGSRTIVIAGPGTGKTAVLAARIAKTINDGAAPDSILALSFTVKAAAELRSRVDGLLSRAGPDSPGGPVTATFHSFCCMMLREHAADAGISAEFEIAGETRREDILRELCKTAKGKNGPGAKKLGNYIEERKRFLLLPGEQEPKTAAGIFGCSGDIPAVPGPAPEMEALYSQYRNRLREAGLLDYEDLIAGAVRLLCAKKTILAEYRRRFRRIFVDEYQDINFSQYALLRLLADGGGTDGDPSLWVIGDPNQAIYGFRGSDKRFIDRFISDYPAARRFELAKSFRCADPIISAAGRLTGSGLRGTEKPVDLYRVEYATDKAEAEGVARTISRLIGGASFFARDSGIAGQDSGGYADTAAPGDCAVLIRAAPLAEAVVKALNDHGIPFELTGEQRWWDEDPFKTFLAKVRESAAPEEAFQKEKDNPALKRLFELAALFGDVRSLLDALAYSGPGGLPEFNREGVNIMTIHASKGLEFDHVFVTGLEDGILPFTLYEDAGALHLEEERRLLYVAMTRARVGLYLSWSRSRIFKGRKLSGPPSPFLSELEHIVPLAESKKAPRKDPQLRLF